MNFDNQVVWITGASSGIGEHLAYAFATEGAQVVLSARNETELERVASRLHQKPNHLILPLDVTQTDRLPDLTRRVIDHFGRIDLLINNAGISQRAFVQDTDLEVDRRVMEVNYFGTIALTKAVLPYLMQQQFGHIVVVSSVMGKLGTAKRSAYAASKHALHGYFDSLRAELADSRIDVTLLCPGFVQTQVSINALTGDGTKHAKMSETTAAGLPPDVFAKRALRAIAARKREVLIGKREIYGVYLKRFFPGMLANIVARRQVS